MNTTATLTTSIMTNFDQTLNNMKLTKEQYDNLSTNDLKTQYQGKIFYCTETGNRVKVLTIVDHCMLQYKTKKGNISYMYYKEFDKEFQRVEAIAA